MRYILIALLLIPAGVGAEPVFTCNGADCTKAIRDRKTWMMQQAAGYTNGLCIDGTNTNYKIVPCETFGVLIDPDANGKTTWGSTCEQRMREAMTAAHDYIMTGRESYGHNMVLLDRDRWSQTYKDCVEGK